jgi:2-C-methyl-D-erythritol 4-phosphate cytidylyltransferase
LAGNAPNDRPVVGVVIAAGGAGRRFGGTLPKQFVRLNGVMVLRRTLAAFQRHPAVHSIVVVAPRAHLPLVERAARGFGKVLRIVGGGAHRQGSVWNGLCAFDPPPAIVLVHDAVRPLVSRSVISGVIDAAFSTGAAVVGVRVKDTITLEGRPGFTGRTLERSRLWAVQTPQGFRFDLLVRAHRAARRAGVVGTDEASLVGRLRVPVRIVQGEYRNIKITTPDDVTIARILLKYPRP